MSTVMFEPVEAQPLDDGALSDAALASLLAQFAAQSVGEEWSEIASQQARAIDYYHHRMPDLPAQEGSSAVVADTVQVTVDDAMAEVLKPFVSTDDYAAFEPVGPEDGPQAEQATAYVNYVLHTDNPGFLILHNWFKDALLTKLGVVKIWWKHAVRTEQRLVNAETLLMLRSDPGYGGEADHGDGTFTATIAASDGRCIVDCIPPEEFRISPFARSIEEAVYSAHAPANVTRSDLVEMGYDRELVYALPTWNGSGGEEGRRNARYRDEAYGSWDQALGTPHASQEVIAFREEYIRVDYDGDGVAELRKVHRVGDVILLNEAVDDNPFAMLCPKPMPHKVYGLSLADDTLELQKIDTVLWRQTLDNLYKSNNPRPIIGEAAERQDGSTLDSLADTAPGAAVYARMPEALSFMDVPFTADRSFPMMQLIEQKRAARTGFQALGNGLDRDVLARGRQMTATQAALVEDKANGRAEMIARIFAETGVKRLMKLILRTLVSYQCNARTIRLRNQWIDVDPRNWNPDMDLTVQVGLGIGNRRDQVAQAQALLEAMDRVAQTPFASLVRENNVYAGLKRFVQALGARNVDDYLTDPARVPPPAPAPQSPPPPDPALVKAQGAAQLKAAELQMRERQAALELELARQESAAKLALDREKAANEIQLAHERMVAEIALERERLGLDAELRQPAHAADAVTVSETRDGGDLDK
jgi:hypothetical protein